jgi:hypothetical protein
MTSDLAPFRGACFWFLGTALVFSLVLKGDRWLSELLAPDAYSNSCGVVNTSGTPAPTTALRAADRLIRLPPILRPTYRDRPKIRAIITKEEVCK